MVRRLLWACGAAIALSSCTIDPIAIEGRACPCPDDYACDAVTQRCRARAASDASAPSCTATTHRHTIASGRRHACAIKAGTLYCWGDNDIGQLGDGTTEARPTPTKVELPGPVVHVSSFDGHVCALLDDQSVYCWGGNENLQTGKAGGDIVTLPTRVGQNFGFITVATGNVFSCGLGVSAGGGTTAGLLCWGARNGGSLADQIFQGPPTESPVSAFGESKFVELGTGLGHGCGARADGRAFCWGYRECNQYGHQYSANPVPALGDCVTDLGMQAHASCFIDGNANLYCLGGHAQGELGIGARTDGQPVLDNDGGVLCENSFPAPQQVLPGTHWKRIAGGFMNACAISTSDELYCWGSNEFRTVADAADPVVAEPAPQRKDVPWAEVAVGFQQICARPEGRERVFCRGRSTVINAAELTEVDFFAQ